MFEKTWLECMVSADILQDLCFLDLEDANNEEQKYISTVKYFIHSFYPPRDFCSYVYGIWYVLDIRDPPKVYIS